MGTITSFSACSTICLHDESDYIHLLSAARVEHIATEPDAIPPLKATLKFLPSKSGEAGYRTSKAVLTLPAYGYTFHELQIPFESDLDATTSCHTVDVSPPVLRHRRRRHRNRSRGAGHTCTLAVTVVTARALAINARYASLAVFNAMSR